MTSNNYRKARRRVIGKKTFYYHLAVFISISIFLFLINRLTDTWDIWFPFPVLSWALLLFFHYLIALGIPFVKPGKKWEEKEINRELNKINRKSLKSGVSPIQRPEIPEELELKDFMQLRQEWENQEFV